MSNTIGETIEKCRPEVQQGLKNLFDLFGTLQNIMRNQKAAELYIELMVCVLIEREKERGNVMFDYDTWKLKFRTCDEIYAEYTGTIVMPY